MSEPTTQDRILDAAEQLFARQGFASTSLRQLTAAARVNLAAVHYHFGSKEGLIRAVFERRLAPLNRERLERLERVEREAAAEGRPAPLEQIVEALVGPALRLPRDRRKGGPQVMRLLGHTISEPDPQIRGMFTEQFREVVERFAPALQRCLPDLEREELLWRFFFMVGAMAHTMALSSEMRRFQEGVTGPVDAEALIRRIVPFVAAGLAAPPAAAPGSA